MAESDQSREWDYRSPSPILLDSDDLMMGATITPRLSSSAARLLRNAIRSVVKVRILGSFSPPSSDDEKENDAAVVTSDQTEAVHRRQVKSPRRVKPNSARRLFPSVESAVDDQTELSIRIPRLDLNALHQHFDSNEPVKSDQAVPNTDQLIQQGFSEAMVSPRSRHGSQEEAGLNTTEAPSPPISHAHRPSLKEEEQQTVQAKSLAKRINSLKRKLKNFEETFEDENGYRPSMSDRKSNAEAAGWLSELSRLRKELQSLRNEKNQPFDIQLTETPIDSSVAETLQILNSRLQQKRAEAKRSENIQELNRSQLQDEKLLVQKALLHYESKHGRPSTREEKVLLRPLYERYRRIKRAASAVVDSPTTSPTAPNLNLEAVPEHDPLKLAETREEKQSPQRLNVAQRIEKSHDSRLQLPTSNPEIESPKGPLDIEESLLHQLSLAELKKEMDSVKTEKSQIRHTLREYEENFRRDTGRRIQKEDRGHMESEYSRYKQLKASIRLLEALISKKATK